MDGLKRQRQIFLSGLSGIKPTIPLYYNELASLASRKISTEAYGYLEGGAGAESTIQTNRDDLNKVHIKPSMAIGVKDANIKGNWENHSLNSPIMFAPIGVLELAHPAGDLALAEASAELDIPMIISSQASYPMEQIAAKLKPDQLRLFQLYHSSSDELSKSFIRRAENIGCKGIILTLDTTVLGWRNRDLSSAYSPFLHGRGIAQYTSDPVFEKLPNAEDADTKPPITLALIRNLLSINSRFPGSTFSNLKSGRALMAVKKFSNYFPNPGLSWEDVNRIRSFTNLPLYLKGIQTSEDALKARAIGANGIIVSNHGGRQVDGGVSTISVVNEIRKSVGSEYPVWMDSGVRTGADIYKCIASGANGVLIGRPYAMALAVNGTKGVTELMNNLLAELALTMTLTGTPDIKSITNNKIVSPWIHP